MGRSTGNAYCVVLGLLGLKARCLCREATPYETFRKNYREREPNKRRAIIASILAQVQGGWGQLFELFSKERDPQRMLLTPAELDEIIESHKARLKAGHS